VIYLVHGTDISTSRKLVINQQLKLSTKNKTELHINDVTPDQLHSITHSFGIFGDTPFLILDISNAGRLNISEHIDSLKDTPEQATVVVLSNKKIPANHYIHKTLKPKSIESEKKSESNIFSFLDSLFSKNRKQTYLEFKTLLKEEMDPFYIFTMISYELRNLAYIIFNSPLKEKMNPYSRSKFEKISNLYNQTAIQNLYTYMYDLDKKTKTGEIDPPLMLTLAIEKVLN